MSNNFKDDDLEDEINNDAYDYTNEEPLEEDDYEDEDGYEEEDDRFCD